MTLPATDFLRGSSAASVTSSVTSYFDNDASYRVGYIIPATGNTSANPTEYPETQLYQAYMTEMYNTFFASAFFVPNADFTSSFRRAPYKRGRLVTGKKISFTFKFDKVHKHAGTYYPGATQTFNDIKFIPDCFQLYMNHSDSNPYDHYREVRPDGWINANIQYYGIPRVNIYNVAPNDPSRFPFEAPMHQYQPMEFANVFIPGLSVTTIFNFFDIRFKYKCVYRSKEFDLE